MRKRIWFNRTFATAYPIVEMIRNNPDNFTFEIYVTHPKRHSVMLQIADYAELEPTLDVPEYIDYCLSFCKKHRIDVFLPNYRLVEISRHIKEFERQGTQVMIAQEHQLLEDISDKGKLFQLFQDVPEVPLPAYAIVNTAEQFQIAYEQLKQDGNKVCFKPARGEGGAGFYIVEEQLDPIDRLFRSTHQQITIEEVVRTLSTRETFEDIMVMEYLDSYEYSIDCLAYEGQLLAAVPRKKVEGRIRELEDNDELLRIAEAVQKRLQLSYLFNVQIKYKEGIPKLLEINPRASGGMYISCRSGVNFPYLALKLLLTGEADVPVPKLDILMTHVERERDLTRIL
ncbi:carbamoyl-phosphate synthase large subunit [Brevibacillus brevis]|uniref:ATP-grasp domain-containing protein n=1 Tax=Brevibacillus brevis TaxID=1393 RepID=UPI001900CF1A|nr:ATP-grasp domain-containing protein [Brevibacillus brevis]MBH0332766.1 carbamoyl-phosphate synthase large subunit [Brevibacillus brevis]